MLLDKDVNNLAKRSVSVTDINNLAKNIMIDVSVDSNLRTGVILEIAKHPLPLFLKHGLRVSLNTDDPFYFGNTLFSEYRQAQDQFGLSDEQLRAIMADSLSFC